ncbi:nucleotide exchange factor GrpE [Fictibacillus sp. Mic-4]|uniref:nucleotide exchange factor GrpE n=1 Tax=Fictibacillus TaxID=1329200 RepID=UPI000412E8A0|nr:nucleotide exchange factor GrpE [Fictibacillus gelatini]
MEKKELDEQLVSEETTQTDNVESEQEIEVSEEVESAVQEEKEEELSEEQQKINQLEQQLEETTQRMLRIQADYENFRRRTREENAKQLKYKSQSLIEQILPALDNFERALNVDAGQDQTKTLLQGMEMVYRQLKEALKSEGLEEIQAVGAAFDPNLHQAVMQVESNEHEANTVVEELQKGYMLKDRVIRPSMVKVSS